MIDASTRTLDDWAGRKIDQVSLVRIYYVGDGRNAWHGTWVRRYYSSSFHVAREQAKQFAERQRVQGSVFRIVELPALSYRCDRGHFLVSELNVACPLKDFRPPLTESRARARAKRCSWLYRERTLPSELLHPASLDYPTVGWTVAEIFKSFEPTAVRWVTPENRRTVVRLLCPAETGDEAHGVRESEKLRLWRSSSLGGQYSLQWHEHKGLSQRAVSRIVARGGLAEKDPAAVDLAVGSPRAFG